MSNNRDNRDNQDPQLQDEVDVREVNKDYDCYLCGKKIINTSAKVVLTFIVSVVVIIFSFVFIFIRGQVTVFAPIIAGVVGFWLPSPVQSAQSRKDAVQSARLLQNNMRMNRMMMRYSSLARPRWENEADEGNDLERGGEQPQTDVTRQQMQNVTRSNVEGGNGTYGQQQQMRTY